MGGSITTSLSGTQSDETNRNSNLLNNSAKIEDFVYAVLIESYSIPAVKSVIDDKLAISAISEHLIVNYRERVDFALKLSKQYLEGNEVMLPVKLSSLAGVLKSKLIEAYNTRDPSSPQSLLLEELVSDAFPSFLLSTSFHKWRVTESSRRRSWLQDAEIRLSNTTFPDMMTSRHLSKELAVADACTVSMHASVLSDKTLSDSLEEHEAAFQPINHENTYNMPSLFAKPVNFDDIKDIQEIMTKSDYLAVKDFAEEGSWLLEFIIAVEDLPIAISVLLEANNNGKYPCVYANKAHEKTVKVSRERLIGQHVGRLDKFLGTNKFLSSLGDAISRMGSTIAIVDCTDRRHIVGLRPVMDDDHSCRYIVCLHEPCSENTIHACKKMDDFLTLIPKDLVCRKEKTGWLAKWERPLIPLENDERNFRL